MMLRLCSPSRDLHGSFPTSSLNLPIKTQHLNPTPSTLNPTPQPNTSTHHSFHHSTHHSAHPSSYRSFITRAVMQPIIQFMQAIFQTSSECWLFIFAPS
ncbi:hypothetical protein EJ06DRAFT_272981 [Trichodelitschia bisporula]|uniref:Uncharacterized protein n=1 Tax=Trichodelitschia bisporula TaxID=703511 RepID=A0A6G1I5J7_9PEZI|nr:hypothetical protein EJ06DRAFT_272981 [Trichodelitschia bisporula]